MDFIAQLTVNGLLIGGYYALMALGITLVFGVTRIVNFAHGELIMLGMFMTYWLNHFTNMNPFVGVVVVAPAMFLIGVFLYRLVLEPLEGADETMQIFTTVGLSIVLMNAALYFWGADFRSLPPQYAQGVWLLGSIALPKGKALGFIVAVVLTTGLFLILKYTPVGRAIRATAQNPYGAQLMGIDVRRVNRWTFGIGAACAGVAGVLLSPFFFIFPGIGLLFVLIAYVVVVLGGMGNMVGALLGGLIIGLVDVFSGFWLGSNLKELAYFAVFALILLLRPTGLLGVRS